MGTCAPAEAQWIRVDPGTDPAVVAHGVVGK